MSESISIYKMGCADLTKQFEVGSHFFFLVFTEIWSWCGSQYFSDFTIRGSFLSKIIVLSHISFNMGKMGDGKIKPFLRMMSFSVLYCGRRLTRRHLLSRDLPETKTKLIPPSHTFLMTSFMSDVISYVVDEVLSCPFSYYFPVDPRCRPWRHITLDFTTRGYLEELLNLVGIFLVS